MPNYSQGKIYKIIDNTNGNVYYGSTTKKYLCDRISGHRSDCKKYLENNTKYCSSFIVLKNNDYQVILIENYPCENKKQLLERERYYIENNECINKEIPGRTAYEYRKIYYKNNKQKFLDLNKTDHRKNYQKDYKIKNKDKQNLYFKQRHQYQSSWGGDSRNSNNLLKIDVNLFN